MLLFPITAALAIAILVVVFALQNADIVSVAFLIWKFEGSLALVLLLAFTMGAIASLLILLPRVMKKGQADFNQKKKIEELGRKLKEKQRGD